MRPFIPGKIRLVVNREISKTSYGQPWQTGARVAKYPRENSPETRESVSMKRPCPESIR
jgi:hypothetical protein